MIREYLKLARSFNSFLTGLSPVMGALAMEQYDIFTLFLLFLIGFLGHTYGFVVNDIIDSEDVVGDFPFLQISGKADKSISSTYKSAFGFTSGSSILKNILSPDWVTNQTGFHESSSFDGSYNHIVGCPNML